MRGPNMSSWTKLSHALFLLPVVLAGCQQLAEDGDTIAEETSTTSSAITINCSIDPDPDNDGHTAIVCGGDDCDETNANRFPGNAEWCDTANVDEDCNPSTFGNRDSDRDGYVDARCCNGSRCGNDCDDSRASVHPSEAESCDLLDNDCDGDVDESIVSYRCRDYDGDGFGVGAPFAVPGCVPDDQPGLSTTCNDCDDKNPALHPAGGQVCASSETVYYCSKDGKVLTDKCDNTTAPIDTTCLTQPSGTGICVPSVK